MPEYKPARLPESRVLRDPVHGYIHIQLEVIWKLINTPEFQRLHRIRQLGADFQVYHGAEHSRFGHSLGCYEITRRMVSEVASLKNLAPEDQTAVLCAALLHDIGHGPFSHLFEKLTHVHHERMSVRILSEPESQVYQVLKAEADWLPERTAAIIEHKIPLLSSMVSSQLDADRMDYLLRDAFFTGTEYGKFDLERILRTLRVHEGKLCVKESGMHSVEDYMMARYHMYWQVYLHPDAKSYERLVLQFFLRYEKVRDQYPIEVFEPLYGEMSLQDFFLLDENRIFYGFQEGLHSGDPILRDFANRLLNRQLFEWMANPTAEERERILKALESHNLDPQWYLFEETIQLSDLQPYKEEDPVWILTRDGLQPLSTRSAIVKALLGMDDAQSEQVYFPKELNPEVRDGKNI